MKTVGFETLSVTNVAVGPTEATRSNANYAVFGPLETASVRWRDDGTVPDASTGHLMNIGDILIYDGKLTVIKFIRTGGTSGALPVSYYQRG